MQAYKSFIRATTLDAKLVMQLLHSLDRFAAYSTICKLLAALSQGSPVSPKQPLPMLSGLLDS